MSPFLRAAMERAELEREARMSETRGFLLPSAGENRGGDAKSAENRAFTAALLQKRGQRIAELRESGATTGEIQVALGLTHRQVAYAEKQARKAARPPEGRVL